MHRAPVLSLVFAALGACSQPGAPPTTGDGGTPDADQPETPPRDDAATGADVGATPTACPAGTVPARYSLTALQSTPPLSALELPGLHPNTIIAPAGNGISDSMRFDLCQGAAGPTLQAILLRGSSFEAPARFVVDASVSSPVQAFVDIPEGKVIEVR